MIYVTMEPTLENRRTRLDDFCACMSPWRASLARTSVNPKYFAIMICASEGQPVALLLHFHFAPAMDEINFHFPTLFIVLKYDFKSLRRKQELPAPADKLCH